MKLANTYIGFDWDGTLELFNLKPSKELIQLLKDLKTQGAQLFLASGKTCVALERVSQGIIEPFMFAGESGGHIRIPQLGIEKFAQGNEDLQRFAVIIQDYDLPPNTQPIRKETIWFRMFGEHSTHAAKIISEVIKKHELQLDVFAHPEIDGAVDVVPRDISKANVLQFIPEGARTFYFGDGENDMALLGHERVFPCTMDNAGFDVKNLVRERQGRIAMQPACLGVYEILSSLF